MISFNHHQLDWTNSYNFIDKKVEAWRFEMDSLCFKAFNFMIAVAKEEFYRRNSKRDFVFILVTKAGTPQHLENCPCLLNAFNSHRLWIALSCPAKVLHFPAGGELPLPPRLVNSQQTPHRSCSLVAISQEGSLHFIFPLTSQQKASRRNVTTACLSSNHSG